MLAMLKVPPALLRKGGKAGVAADPSTESLTNFAATLGAVQGPLLLPASKAALLSPLPNASVPPLATAPQTPGPPPPMMPRDPQAVAAEAVALILKGGATTRSRDTSVPKRAAEGAAESPAAGPSRTDDATDAWRIAVLQSTPAAGAMVPASPNGTPRAISAPAVEGSPLVPSVARIPTTVEALSRFVGPEETSRPLAPVECSTPPGRGVAAPVPADSGVDDELLAMLSRLGVVLPSMQGSKSRVATPGVPTRDSAAPLPPAGPGLMRARVAPVVERMAEAWEAPVVATPSLAEAAPVPSRLGPPVPKCPSPPQGIELLETGDSGLAAVESDDRKTARGPQDPHPMGPHPTVQHVALEPSGRLPLAEHVPAAVARMLANPPTAGGTRRQVVEVRLDPPTLGTIQVRIEERVGEVHAHFVVPSERVERMVNAELSRLHETLAQQGISLGSTSVETGGQGKGQPGREPQRRRSQLAREAAPAELAVPPLQSSPAVDRGRLNIRI